MSDTCSQFMCRDCITIYSSLTQAQSLCVKTWAPSLCTTITTHTQVPHVMTTQAQNPCATMTTLVQGHHATMTTRAQTPCATMSTPAHYDDEGTALHR